MWYDDRFNALVINGSTVYFVKVSPQVLATLCRAIDGDEKARLGVSLGRVQLVYGALPEDSDIAWDMKLADNFIGDMVFARNEWTRGYRFANGYVPQEDHDVHYGIAVFNTFDGFEFRTVDGEARLVAAGFSARLFPLSQGASADGGLMPDSEAIAKGQMSARFQANARHLADNIGYYRRERILARMFTYGEVASVLRKLKNDGFDLGALAQHISKVKNQLP